MRGYTYTRLTICLLLLLCIIATCFITIQFNNTNNVAFAEEDEVLFDVSIWRNTMQAWYEWHLLDIENHPFLFDVIIEKDSSLSVPFATSFDVSRYAIVIRFNGSKIVFTGLEKNDLVGLFAYEYISPVDGDAYYQHALQYITRFVGLEYLDFSDIVTTSSMFRGLTELESIDLSSANFENCLDFSYMFYDCTSLKTIKMPQTVYGANVRDIRGMFCNTALTDLDLTNFAPLSLDKSLDYNTRYVTGENPFPQFISQRNNLVTFKMPDNELTQNFNVNLIPQSLLEFEFGEFAIDNGEMEICYCLEDMIGYTDTLYRVGDISYVVLYNGKEIVIDTDQYLATLPYKSKTVDSYKIQRKIPSIVYISFGNSFVWAGEAPDGGLFEGKPGEVLTYTPEDLDNSDYESPAVGNKALVLYGVLPTSTSGAKMKPANMAIDVSKYGDGAIIGDDGVAYGIYGDDTGNDFSFVIFYLFIGSISLSVIVLIGLAIAKGRYVDINGKPTLVFITKSGNKYCHCVSLNRKKYRVKKMVLRRNKNNIDDVVHIKNSDKDVEEIPFFKKETF